VILGKPLRWWREDEVCAELGRAGTRPVREILEELAGEGILERNGNRRFRLVEAAIPAERAAM
jgi:DNA-binding GntR family transcriptional regulator